MFMGAEYQLRAHYSYGGVDTCKLSILLEQWFVFQDTYLIFICLDCIRFQTTFDLNFFLVVKNICDASPIRNEWDMKVVMSETLNFILLWRTEVNW